MWLKLVFLAVLLGCISSRYSESRPLRPAKHGKATAALQALRSSHKRKFVGTQSFGSDILDRLSFGSVLGSGSYGTVYSAWDKLLKKEVAVKVLHKSRNSNEEVQSEMAILSKLPVNKHVCQFFGHLEDHSNIFLIQELCGVNNLRHLLDRSGVTEEEVKDYFGQFLDGMIALHRANIYHLDLKPANIMLTSEGVIKIIDFGKSITSNSLTYEDYGSVGYRAPETLDNQSAYPSRLDVWYMGITLFRMMFNMKPFGDDENWLHIRKVTTLDFQFPTNPKSSSEFKDLIRHMLAFQDQRYTLAQIQQHAWLANKRI